MASPHFVNKSWPLLQDPGLAFARFYYYYFFVFLLFISDECHMFDEMLVWGLTLEFSSQIVGLFSFA